MATTRTPKNPMPPRQSDDGPVRVSRDGPRHLVLDVTQDGQHSELRVSEYNAWRLFGMLSLMLQLPLPKAVVQAIKL